MEKSFDLSELKNTVSTLADLKEAWLAPPIELIPDMKAPAERGITRPEGFL